MILDVAGIVVVGVGCGMTGDITVCTGGDPNGCDTATWPEKQHAQLITSV